MIEWSCFFVGNELCSPAVLKKFKLHNKSFECNIFVNDKYSLWKTVFGEERPSAEEFLEKMDDLVIKN